MITCKFLKNIILLGLLVLLACKENSRHYVTNEKYSNGNENYEEIDTVLEKNDPKRLDLSKQQLFIDTTRTSQFYQSYLDWNPNLQQEDFSDVLNLITKKYPLQKQKISNFPRKWITIEKLNGEFLIYRPCNGNTESFVITDEALYFFHQLEPEVALLHQVITSNDTTFNATLHTLSENNTVISFDFSIQPSATKDVYQLKYSHDTIVEERYVIPMDKVTHFNLVVNHCPEDMVREYDNFDY
ncbi:MAG: hypothetical protein CMP76_14590 [Flavobacterium sp.]|nr:hypothetical protein [Flavobacterium sp.]